MINHYILTLKGETKRQAHVKKQFEKLGIRPNFFEGTDGRILSRNELRNLCINEAMLPGEIGCSESHLSIMKALLLTDKLSAFVFEDDVEFSDRASVSILTEFQQFIESKTYTAVLNLRKRKRLGKVIYKTKELVIYECFRATGTISYLINRSAAKAVLEENIPIRFEADAWGTYSAAKILKLYALDEDLCQEWIGSDGEIISTIGINKYKACHSMVHKKLVDKYLEEHGYTKFDWLRDSIKAYYYMLKRKL